jgi:hypothetical protein
MIESQRIMIQGDLKKGEGLSSRDQIQRRKVKRCGTRKPNNKKSKDRFLGRADHR